MRQLKDDMMKKSKRSTTDSCPTSALVEKYQKEIKRFKEVIIRHDETIKQCTQVWLHAWSDNDPRVIKNTLSWLIDVIRKTLGNKKYRGLFNLKKSEGETDQESQTELHSFANEVLAEYTHTLSAWKTNGCDIRKFPDIYEFITQKINDLRADRLPYKEVEYRDDIEHGPVRLPPSKDKKRDSTLYHHSANNIKILAKVIGIPNEELNNDKDLLDFTVTQIAEFKKNAVSVQQVTKIYNISPYRRFLYTLQKIAFPMITMTGQKANIIVLAPQKLKTYVDLIRYIWYREDRFKQWIRFLRDRGWSKSKISHFMGRSIDRKIVPKVYFEIFPPSRLRLEYIQRNKKGKLPYPEDVNIWHFESSKIIPFREMYALLGKTSPQNM